MGQVENTEMTVYLPSTPVFVGEKFDIPAVIDAVIIRYDKRVLYTVGWWNAGSRVCADLHESQFKVNSAKPQKIGFQ